MNGLSTFILLTHHLHFILRIVSADDKFRNGVVKRYDRRALRGEPKCHRLINLSETLGRKLHQSFLGGLGIIYKIALVTVFKVVSRLLHQFKYTRPFWIPFVNSVAIFSQLIEMHGSLVFEMGSR